MNKLLIYEYIKNIKRIDIYNYAFEEGIKLSKNEIDILYDYIKNRYIDIMNNPKNVLIEIKDKLSINTYNKLLELYNKYKDIIYKLK